MRRFKDVRSSRPLHSGAPNGVAREDMIVNGCESTPLDSPIQPVRNVKATDTFWLKETPYSLSHMFGEQGQRKGYPSLFAGGTVYQAFLSALSYHRWHSPVKGVVRDIYKLPGTYFSDQSQINLDYDSSSPDRSQAFIASVATRQVFIIESSNPKIGKIAIIYIGKAESTQEWQRCRAALRRCGSELG